ncbi:MAG: hypothetical protein HOO91_11395 [Bacteroidales bacterium]|nr:hypothetical protein [Bacteroidales bacterium]
MKKLFFLAFFLLSCILGNGQDDKFSKAMLANMEKAKSAYTSSDLQELSANYERIALAEQTQWTAWYYAAYYYLAANYMETDVAKKKNYLDHAQNCVDEGVKLKPEESELLVLKVMILYGLMAVDQTIAMETYPKTVELLEQAKSLNPDNPRIYLTQAEAIYNMPVEFGGGKEKAKSTLQIAKEKFDKYTPANILDPNWGKERCEMLLGECQK